MQILMAVTDFIRIYITSTATGFCEVIATYHRPVLDTDILSQRLKIKICILRSGEGAKRSTQGLAKWVLSPVSLYTDIPGHSSSPMHMFIWKILINDNYNVFKKTLSGNIEGSTADVHVGDEPSVRRRTICPETNHLSELPSGCLGIAPTFSASYDLVGLV